MEEQFEGGSPHPFSSDRESSFPQPGGLRGRTFYAWLAILAMILLSQFGPIGHDEGDMREMSLKGMTVIGQIEGRLSVGINEIANLLGGDLEQELKTELKSQLVAKSGRIVQRMQSVAIVGEILGSSKALDAISQVQAEILLSMHPLTPEESRLIEVVRTIYIEIGKKADPFGELSQEDREFLKTELGWSGQLMLVPQGISPPDRRESVISSARRFATVALFGMAAGAIGILSGLVFAIVIPFLSLTGLISFGLRNQSLAGEGGSSGIYLEAFAVWLAVFQTGSLFISSLSMERVFLIALMINMLSSMSIAVLWPVLRGLPWSVVRRDLGWHFEKGIILEPLFGLVGYLATLPLLILGIVLMFLGIAITGALLPPEAVSDPFTPQEVPMHPIVLWVAEGNRLVLIQVALLACVIAPFIEETMFRGFLQRYLRDASQWAGFTVSFLFSMIFNSLIFAAIHPQGPLAIPVLTAIACGLSILREWRGSLWAPMVAHGLNNSIVMSILFGAVW